MYIHTRTLYRGMCAYVPVYFKAHYIYMSNLIKCINDLKIRSMYILCYNNLMTVHLLDVVKAHIGHCRVFCARLVSSLDGFIMFDIMSID